MDGDWKFGQQLIFENPTLYVNPVIVNQMNLNWVLFTSPDLVKCKIKKINKIMKTCRLNQQESSSKLLQGLGSF